MSLPHGTTTLPARRITGLLAPLACVALACASPAVHAASASAVLDWSGFSISVIDIDANDGINAGYSFASTVSRTTLCLGDSGCPGPVGPWADDWISQGSATDSFGTMWGAASFSKDALWAEGVGLSPGGERSVGASRSAMLTLEGRSEVTITVPYSLSVDAGGAGPQYDSFAYAGLIVSSIGIANSQLSTATDGTASSSQFLRLHWTNDSDYAVSYMGADAFARLVSPVPEPAPFALMAGGVALLGLFTRARKQVRPSDAPVGHTPGQ